MNGVGGELFAPNDSATRTMAVMLWRMEGEKTGKASPFTDVKAGSWYEQAVNWAAETDVVKGISGIDSIRESFGIEISRNGFDHLLWY